MTRFLIAVLVVAAAMSGAANAALVAVPEMDAGAGVAAIALVIGAAAIIREKFFRK